MSNLFRLFMKKYDKFLLTYPLLGNASTSGVGMATGNLICQLMMYHKEKKIDLLNTLQYGTYGFFISGPYLKFWWYALDLKIFKNRAMKFRSFKMMLLDQATTPFILNAIFLFYLGKLDGKTNSGCLDDIKKKLMPIAIESYKVWPLATLLNFYVIPLHNRVLFSNSVAILWVTYLTYLVGKNE